MKLMETIRVGAVELKNRVVMAPMTRSRARGASPNAMHVAHYRSRASAGLIVTEGTAPSPNGLGYARIPGIYSPAQVRAWHNVTEAVHEDGGRIFVQLMHVGRIAHTNNLPEGARIVAPSAVAAHGTMYTDQTGPEPFPTPEAMSPADIKLTIEEFAAAARNARAAGFDGIELHAANGYLLEQFLHPHTNRRDDAYGGGTSARSRFVLEVVEAVVAAIGADRVGIRLSPFNTFNDLPESMLHEEVVDQYAELGRALRGIAYLHVIQSQNGAYPQLEPRLRTGFAGPLILNGGFDADSAEDAVVSGRAALVSFGRPFISHPNWVERLREHQPALPPDPATLYTPGPEGYVTAA